MKRKHDKTPKGKAQKLNNYLGDPKLIPRMKQCLQQKANKATVDLDNLADELQRNYGEYARKKRNSFVKSIERAYEVICTKENSSEEGDEVSKFEEKYLRKKSKQDEYEKTGDSTSATASSDDSDAVMYEDTNAMNKTLSDLYKNSPAPAKSSTPLYTPIAGMPLHGSTRSANKTFPAATEDTILYHKLEDTVKSSMAKQLHFGGDIDTGVTSSCNIATQATLSTASGIILNPASDKSGAKTEAVETMDEPKSSRKRKRKIQKEDSTDPPPREKKKAPDVQRSNVTFADIGGNEECLKEICRLLVHMKHPEVYEQLGITPPRGFLLHGPPGCGKTLLANAIAGEMDLPLIKLASTEIVSGVSGESEERLRDLFEKAVTAAPCILFIDEIDAITPKRETASKDMERRIVSQLLSCMDDLSNKASHVLVIGATNRPDSLDPGLRRAGRFDREISLGIPDEKARKRILQVLCRKLKLNCDVNFAELAHNSPGYVGADLMALIRESAMTAVNRIFHELEESQNEIDSDPVSSRAAHINSQTVECSTECNVLPRSKTVIPVEVTDGLENEIEIFPDNDGESVIKETKYNTDSGKDAKEEKMSDACRPEESDTEFSKELISVLAWLKNQSTLTEEQLTKLCITMQDFQLALKIVQPSAKREGFATIPDVTWENIGALHDVREELQLAILAPVRHPEEFLSLGLKNPPGILLAGPPGCGKTLLAKAVANESGINFISVKGPELLNMYVGESERAVRQVFQRARNSAPCVIFFDELDSLCPRRTGSGEGGASVRVVNQMLTEMDGLEERRQVFIMAATNRPDIIDRAILRPGRLDKILYVGLPTVKDRQDILKTITKNGTLPLLSEDVNLDNIAQDARCDGFSGADLSALVREASVNALRELITEPQSKKPGKIAVNMNHFEKAFTKVHPSVSEQDKRIYEKMNISLPS